MTFTKSLTRVGKPQERQNIITLLFIIQTHSIRITHFAAKIVKCPFNISVGEFMLEEHES